MYKVPQKILIKVFILKKLTTALINHLVDVVRANEQKWFRETFNNNWPNDH
jgi:hypothetical protein